MPTHYLALAVALLLSHAVTASAQSPSPGPLPSNIAQALETFRTDGAAAGVKALTPGWSSGADADKQVQLIDAFAKLEPFAGKMLGYDVARTVSVSNHLQRNYLVLLYERQPVYLLLTLYQPPGTPWQVVTFNFHTDPRQVFPPSLLESEFPAGKP